MPTQLQLRRGTTSQNNSFTGAVGELSVDTDLDQIRIHDGSTAGGILVPVEGGDLGLSGNTNPAASTTSFGTPANAVIRVSATGVANLIMGDASATSGFNLDIRGTANVSTIATTIGGLTQANVQGVAAELVPAGTIIASGATATPNGYLLCDGATPLRTTYSRLFNAIGTGFGAGNGNNTFAIPDLKDRLLLGKGTNNNTLGTMTGSMSASSVKASESTSIAAHSLTTATFATSAKDSSQATAVTAVAAHAAITPNMIFPTAVVNFYIKE
tara:strand:+ start:495 stop:1307 length:813 start_codon:yes stop_codon:yes gene_type:complete